MLTATPHEWFNQIYANTCLIARHVCTTLKLVRPWHATAGGTATRIVCELVGEMAARLPPGGILGPARWKQAVAGVSPAAVPVSTAHVADCLDSLADW